MTWVEAEFTQEQADLYAYWVLDWHRRQEWRKSWQRAREIRWMRQRCDDPGPYLQVALCCLAARRAGEHCAGPNRARFDGSRVSLLP